MSDRTLSEKMALAVSVCGIGYALYLALHGFPGMVIVEKTTSGLERVPFRSAATVWPFGYIFAASLFMFFVGMFFRLIVVATTGLIVSMAFSAILFTSYGLHFAAISTVLAVLLVRTRKNIENA